jgi:hypothetical protein
MMRRTLLALPFLALPTFAPEAGALPADSPIRPESRVWITGASNLRRFTCRAREVEGSLLLRANATRSAVMSGENVSTEPSLRVVVDRVDCGIGVMNRHLHDALRGAAYPIIEFRLGTYEVDLASASPAARIVGQVTIGGVQRPVAVTASVRADSLGAMHVQGTYVIQMRDFGVAAPRRFGGLLRVRDQITVHFDVTPDADGGAIDRIRCSLAQSVHAALMPGATYGTHS